jgi:endonuclease YncB( thermonuclease family)
MRQMTLAFVIEASAVICVLSVFGQPAYARPPEFTGIVEQVIDGDTIQVRDTAGKLRNVRINWIDAPEEKQKWGSESRDSLKKEIAEKKVRVVPYRDEDPLPSDVYHDGKFLSEKRLSDGWAWNYVPYSTDKKLIAAEADAKAAKRGIWRDAKLEPPWEFRKRAQAAGATTEITWEKYVEDCGLKAQDVNEAKTEANFRDKYKGKPVRWSGQVVSVKEKPIGEGYFVGVRMTPSESILSSSSDLTLSVLKKHKEKVLALKKDDMIEFAGKLSTQGGRVLNHDIEAEDFKVLP